MRTTATNSAATATPTATRRALRSALHAVIWLWTRALGRRNAIKPNHQLKEFRLVGDRLAALHHEADVLEHGHVAQRVALDRDQVGGLAGGQRADLVGQPVV